MHTEPQPGAEPAQQINGAAVAPSPAPTTTNHVDEVIAAQQKVEQGRTKAIEILLGDKAVIDAKLRALGHKIKTRMPSGPRVAKIAPEAPAETPKPSGRTKGGAARS